jgi:hypothetical protein
VGDVFETYEQDMYPYFIHYTCSTVVAITEDAMPDSITYELQTRTLVEDYYFNQGPQGTVFYLDSSYVQEETSLVTFRANPAAYWLNPRLGMAIVDTSWNSDPMAVSANSAYLNRSRCMAPIRFGATHQVYLEADSSYEHGIVICGDFVGPFHGYNAGWIQSMGVGLDFNYDYHLHAVTRNGVRCGPTGPQQDYCIRTVSTPEAAAPALVVTAYPNPASTTLTVQVSLEGATAAAAVQYQLLTPLGQQVQTGSWQGTQHTLQVDHLPAGVYLLHVQAPHTGATTTLRWVKW